MRYAAIEQWSRQQSVLHRRDARAKIGALLAFLIAVSTTAPASRIAFAGYALLLAAAIAAARLPFPALVRRAALVLPVAAGFALVLWFSDERARAVALLEKSFLSAVATLLLVATTPMPELLRALEILHLPRLLVLVIHFLYRYLFVISGQARRMRLAASSRGRLQFRSAAGALAVLFARSWERASGIYRAMLARGFSGQFPALAPPRWRAADAAFFIAAVLASVAVRVAL
ncbi:MAG TPA: energy-coupling factor transporter transmembrane component T [Bryobacteraceae bacterium]|nr:energy-coupling factor transporter transmembrane component T [Bryobacteraceae bacterium]